ncbi:MAG: type II toxin-antitoxin system PemK/MazF family toxin [Leptospira sp.]|nr:type II toxin-antitoxin system PemK/MazF family toxin [Leptospira sp.]
MIACEAGDILLIPFPFSELYKVKKRPALLLCFTEFRNSYSLATIAMITSQVDGSRQSGDVMLADWAMENLLHPSILRLSKIATVDRTLIISKLGTLSKRDFASTKHEFNKVFSTWI